MAEGLKEYTGLYFPYCILDLVRGVINTQQVKSIQMTKIPKDYYAWKAIIDYLGKYVWMENPRFAAKITWDLVNTGKFELVDRIPYNFRLGSWLDSEGNQISF